MDERIQDIKSRLEKIKNKCPNLSNIWNMYIETKKKSLEDSLDQCEKVLTQLESQTGKDMSQNTILFMYLLSNTI